MKDKYYEYVGKRIREARLQKGYTQQYVSDMLHIGRPLYSQYERGACTISMKMWKEIALFLDLDAFEVMESASEYERSSNL